MRLSLVRAIAAAGFALAAAPAVAMDFKLVSIGGARCGDQCPQVIAATGEIELDTAGKFADFLRERIRSKRLRNVVVMHSPGGNVVGALKLGVTLRRLGSAVVIAQVGEAQGEAIYGPGRCMSACAYALMGGKKRVVPPPSQVGLHRMSITEYGRDPANQDPSFRRIFATGNMITALSRYASTMGVSVEAIRAAEQVAPTSIHIVTPQELAKWRLGTPKF